MTADDFIDAAIERGQADGLATLSADERFVFLIADAEACCDIDGLDALLDRYSPDDLADCAAAFAEVGAADIAAALGQIISTLPNRNQWALGTAECLIKARAGYDCATLRAAVCRRLKKRGTGRTGSVRG
jgi:hypothetical protein